MLTTGTYMIVNFKRMLERNVNFLFLLSTHPINSLSKAGKALVNTISSTSYAVPLYR